MALKKVQRLNYFTSYAFAPPSEDAVINTAEIVSVTEVVTRRNEPCVAIRFRNGDTMTALGRPRDFQEE